VADSECRRYNDRRNHVGKNVPDKNPGPRSAKCVSRLDKILSF
jgi:hypothetical protein